MSLRDQEEFKSSGTVGEMNLHVLLFFFLPSEPSLQGGENG